MREWTFTLLTGVALGIALAIAIYKFSLWLI